MNGIHVQKCIDVAKHTTISDKAIERLYGLISESSNITHDIEEDNSVIYDLAHAILSYLLYSYSEIENLNNILPNIHFNKLALQSTYETLQNDRTIIAVTLPFCRSFQSCITINLASALCKYLEIFKDYNWRNIYVFEFESNDVYSVINQTMCNIKSILIPQIDHAQIDRLYNDIVAKDQNNYINSETNNIKSINQTETTSNTKTYSLKQNFDNNSYEDYNKCCLLL